MMKLDGWAQVVLAIAAIVIAGAIAWGQLVGRVGDNQQQLAGVDQQVTTDHDILLDVYRRVDQDHELLLEIREQLRVLNRELHGIDKRLVYLEATSNLVED